MADPREVVQRYFEAVPGRDFNALRQLIHPGYSYTSGDGQRQEGADAAIAIAELYTGAFPDLQIDMQHLHTAGDVVVVEFIGRGTHQGELMGLAPTGRKMAVRVCNILEVRDGKIYAEREYFDMADMMRQLGGQSAAAHA